MTCKEICCSLDRNSFSILTAGWIRLDEEFEGLAAFPLHGRYPKEFAKPGLFEYRELSVTPYRFIRLRCTFCCRRCMQTRHQDP